MTTKKLVVFYSYEGNTRLIAHTIAQVLGADVLECKPVKDISSKSFMKYMWGGRQVIFKRKPALEPLEKSPHDYDTIIIGTPVWAYDMAPAILSFLTQFPLKNKNIVLFCCHEGAKGKSLEHMKELLSKNTILGENDFLNVIKNKQNNIEKATQWALTLKDQV